MKAIILNTVFALLLVFYGCGTDNLVGTGTAPNFDHGPHFFDKSGGEKVIVAENDEHNKWYWRWTNCWYPHNKT